MRKLALILSLTASPALATGLDIEIAGEAGGTVHIDLYEDVAPQHVERITALAERGAYDGVVFHRVIDGFMAQTGDVQFGKAGGDLSRAGTGGSDLPDLQAEFSDRSFGRGTVGMARSASPDSANSQFFINFAATPHLDGQYTIVGEVTEGMEIVDQIKRGAPGSGAVSDTPDVMESVTVTE
ncbi:peptidylprolyl isomerase [Palleronia marisminoris]|uniref:Peptidyl-prolyl cis-trans isomerase n=1 Tax=Palleronia marisminoris TaxID=315423 RepID=A0A1Y5RGE6_9RHOB|nr:peptidylprolyl isomerase [Palleronia marisminoris]SFG18240.1 peptidylprolyl isomerase [Palleronia marisminoris]SLN16862.1 Peptidyl-prolyl cis-trans isomerase B [Palleronia marisminoris]